AEAPGRVAQQPTVQRSAVDAMAGGDIGDGRVGVEHLTHGQVALLNHRQLLQHELPLDSAGPKSTEWSECDTGTEASVAQDPKPGLGPRHRCRGRCETDVPDSHTCTWTSVVGVAGLEPAASSV